MLAAPGLFFPSPKDVGQSLFKFLLIFKRKLYIGLGQVFPKDGICFINGRYLFTDKVYREASLSLYYIL